MIRMKTKRMRMKENIKMKGAVLIKDEKIIAEVFPTNAKNGEVVWGTYSKEEDLDNELMGDLFLAKISRNRKYLVSHEELFYAGEAVEYESYRHVGYRIFSIEKGPALSSIIENINHKQIFEPF